MLCVPNCLGYGSPRKQSMGYVLLCQGMALPVMEFQDKGYKIRKVFAKKSTYSKEIIEF